MRRARIKAVANLSASRRAASKSNTELSNKTRDSENESNKVEQKESSKSIPVDGKSSENLIEICDVKVAAEDEQNVSEKCQETLPAETTEKIQKSISYSFEPPTNALRCEPVTFKTPLQMPRVDGDQASTSSSVPSSILGSIKHRRFKVAPRLIASRNALNVEETEDFEEAQTEASQELLPDFMPPTLTRTRPDTPRDVVDQPSFVVNHNIQHSGAPPSPFPYLSHGHSRIRTESLCSMKSNRDVTVANLQPRKNIRTEDQKIIDIKRESRERLSNKDLDKSQLTMFDMIYFNPQNNPMKPRDPHKTEKPKKVEVLPEVQETSPVKKEPSAIPVPQLRIDANGDMVLDETSLVVENEQQKQNRILLATTDVVYDDELSGHYGHYKRQQRTKEWQQDETVKFYRCLNTIGPDFSLMLNMFPNRCRRDLKLKFKKEEKNNPQLIDKALLKHNTFDLDELQREFDQEEEERKKEAEAKSSSEVKELVKRKILKKQEAKLKAELHTKSKIEKILAHGEFAMGIVDNLELKENLELDEARLLSHVPAKRQYKKKPKKTETVAVENLPSNVNIMDGLTAMCSEATPKRSRKKPVLSNAMLALITSNDLEPMLKKQRGSPKSPKKQSSSDIVEKLDDSEEAPSSAPSSSRMKLESFELVAHHMEEGADLTQTSESCKNEKQLLPPITVFGDIISPEHWKTEKAYCSIVSEVFHEDVPMEIEVAGSETTEVIPTSAACDEFAEQIQSQADEMAEPNQYVEPQVTETHYQDPQQNTFDEMPMVFYDTATIELTPSTETEPPNASSFEILPSIDDSPETSSATALKQEKTLSPEKKPEKKPKQRKKKIRPVLVSRLKLDKDGEMVLDDSSATSQEKEKKCIIVDPLCNEEPPNKIDQTPLETPEQIVSDTESNKIPLDENLNKTLIKQESFSAAFVTLDVPSTSSCCAVREEFDGEAFLDSLDLERMVLVEARRDGKDVYEIHEMDPETQEIAEKPLDLPSRYVDLIISVMKQQEEEAAEEDEA